MNDGNKQLLGDAIADVLEKTGVADVVTKVATSIGVDDCGCKKRQERLNNLHKSVQNKLT